MKITIERETPAGMIYPPKPPPRHCGYIPDGSGVKWNAYDTMQMEAYARAAYADGFAAAQPVEPQEPVAWLKTMYSGTRPMLEVDHMTPPNLKSFPVYAAPPAPAAVPLTDAQVDAISMGLFGCINAAYRKQITDAVLSSGGGGITCATKRTVAQVRTATSAAPAAVPLTDEQILEIAEPFGCFQYGDAQGHKRIEFARAVLAAGDKP